MLKIGTIDGKPIEDYWNGLTGLYDPKVVPKNPACFVHLSSLGYAPKAKVIVNDRERKVGARAVLRYMRKFNPAKEPTMKPYLV